MSGYLIFLGKEDPEIQPITVHHPSEGPAFLTANHALRGLRETLSSERLRMRAATRWTLEPPSRRILYVQVMFQRWFMSSDCWFY